jgi:putative DNA methylase
MTYKKKLIEVSIPIQNINDESIKERNIRHSHPSTLHRYWARRPLASSKGLLLATLIDDPSNDKTLTNDEIKEQREYIFHLISEYIKWDNRHNEDLYQELIQLVKKSCNINSLNFLDPFSGGGSIPIESQRLGITTFATDLNPLAVIINKALIEYPYKFLKTKRISPALDTMISSGSESGFGSDIDYYGKMLIKNVKNRLSKNYKTFNNETVIGWLQTKEVECLNPSCRAKTPALKTYRLSARKNRVVTLNPIIKDGNISFTLSYDNNATAQGNIKGKSVFCLVCGQPSKIDDLNEVEKIADRPERTICVITEGDRKRNYHIPNEPIDQNLPGQSQAWEPDLPIPVRALGISLYKYGFTNHSKLYNSRQRLFLTSIVSEINIVSAKIAEDIKKSGISGALEEYEKAIVTYLALLIGRIANQSSRLTRWDVSRESIQGTYVMQALEMKWEYIETNPFSSSSGNALGALDWITRVVKDYNPRAAGTAAQVDATDPPIVTAPIIITDPPYYDNVGYADLSDYFYLWLKNSLQSYYPEIFSTISTPKRTEIIADPSKHGSKLEAENHFLNGMEKVAKRISEYANEDFPVVYYYAFKQTESSFGGEHSTGWETFLLGLIRGGFQIKATWPIRTELPHRTRAIKSNALASSIAIALRKRSSSAPLITRREFIDILSEELDMAIKQFIAANITPVDMQQSAIGPGMAVFSRYSKVLEPDGTQMSVRSALQVVNSILDKIQDSSNIDMDSDTRFCIQWFEAFGYEEKEYADAETLARAKDISVEGLVSAGVFVAIGGKAQLRHWKDMSNNWDPRTDTRLTLWECTHHLIRELVLGDGQHGAARLVKLMGNYKAEDAKDLAYQLFHICDKKDWAKLGGNYNLIVTNWPDIKAQVSEISGEQETLF